MCSDRASPGNGPEPIDEGPLAQLVPPGTGVIDGHVIPAIQRMTDRMRDLPVGVFHAAWYLVTCNALFASLMGEPPGDSARECNLCFSAPTGIGDAEKLQFLGVIGSRSRPW